MDVAEAIRLKRAVRAFADEPLSPDDVTAILNAGRRAQSSKNTQPWRFVAVQDRSTLKTLAGLGTYAGHLEGAALGVVIATPDPAQRWSILFDAGQAAAYMQLAAWERGIGSCLATLYESEAARTLLALPPELHVNVALSFGRPQDPSVMTSAPRPGGRQPAGSLVHWERW
jgi:nitroreductase